MISVGVVNADQMLLDGLNAWLRLAGDIRLTAASRTAEGLLRSISARLEVTVLFLLPGDHVSQIDDICKLLESGSKVLAVGDVSSPQSRQLALGAGASAYLTKDHGLDTLAVSIRELAGVRVGREAQRRPSLAPQERAVLIAYASGLTLAAAARQIGVQPVTAKNYLARVKEKYRQAGRPTFTKLDLAARVREDGL